MRFIPRGLALFLAWCLLFVSVRDGFADQTDGSVSQQPPQAAHQSPDQLQQLAAPIALYPDTLIAQIMAAATYPDQVIEANWRPECERFAKMRPGAPRMTRSQRYPTRTASPTSWTTT